MKPERRSRRLLSITRSKAKMYEYDVPEQYHIDIPRNPANLFPLTIGLLGDLAAQTNWEAGSGEPKDESGSSVLFSAQFFDNYLQTHLQEELDPYLLLLGAAAYYLCDLPGSSVVLANHVGETCPNLGCLGLEELLLWLLQRRLHEHLDGSAEPYGKHIDGVTKWMIHYFENGSGQDRLFEHASNLRRIAYDIGAPRQLLFADVIGAVVQRRFDNSTWHCLPRYSDLSTDRWKQALQKETFIRELWPAQHLLGECGIFRGRSAVVQMPTSAGKTKATEIVVRRAFLADRTSLAIIVAPFRALCHEIRNDLAEAFRGESIKINELSDVFQLDFEIMELLGERQILVVTPEKLVYALRHGPELADRIGLLIYDEGHQFDSGTRGITYELLLTSLKMMVPEETQALLISAVIRNAAAVGEWLNGEDSVVISGTQLTPTYRSLAFTSWQDRLGRLEFVDHTDPDSQEFFVPRIIEQQPLQLRGRERKQRVFPERSDGRDVALYLGLKIASKGSVAIFCGRKSTAFGLCRRVVDAYSRGLSLKQPREHSDEDEIVRLHFLHRRNLGAEAIATESAALGVFAHHGNTPRGIRLAVEYAMKEGLAKLVICTSTLAQGVNLPIRYLVVTSVYQGQARIKVRDFHNLIGRAGRSGMYTEGSIVFADPLVYDERNVAQGRWRWNQVKELLEPSNAEPCTSRLASIFDPLYSDDRKYSIQMEPLDFVRAYVNDEVDALVRAVATEHEDKNFTTAGLEEQIASKMNIISVTENYLMAHWDDSSNELQDSDVTELASETLAYFLAEGEQRDQLIELFKLLARNIGQKVPDLLRRKTFGKTLYGVQTSIVIENWTKQHIDDLIACDSYDDLLLTMWPLISKNVQNNTFNKCNPPEVLQDIALAWIQGRPFYELLAFLKANEARIGAGPRPRYPTMEHAVDICENALSFDGTLLIGAVAEIAGMVQPAGAGNLVRNLHKLQKQVKYGLPSSSAITLYEMGFADRVVSSELSLIISLDVEIREIMAQVVRKREVEIRAALEEYPRYFTHILSEML